jgi:hypothetical protein
MQKIQPLKFGDAFLIAFCVTLLGFSLGCALLSKTSTADQKLRDVQNLSYAAASIGTSEALLQNPAWRTRFVTVEKELDQLIAVKSLTGDLLRTLINDLPVNELKSPQARIAIESATVLFDSSVGTTINIEDEPYLLAAATGIRDGLKVALVGASSVEGPASRALDSRHSSLDSPQ